MDEIEQLLSAMRGDIDRMESEKEELAKISTSGLIMRISMLSTGIASMQGQLSMEREEDLKEMNEEPEFVELMRLAKETEKYLKTYNAELDLRVPAREG